MEVADITIVPVPSEHKDSFLAFSKRMATVYRDHGATRVVDYWQSGHAAHQNDFHADGVSYEPDELRSIGTLIGASVSESVVVTVMTWPSREARDRGMAAASRDARVLATIDEAPVFDGGRMTGETFEITMNLHDA